MITHYGDKREFLRHRCDKPVNFKILLSPKDKGHLSESISGISKDLSASGILFASSKLPEIASIIALDLDYRTTNICREIEGEALIINNRLIGKVVRIEENDDGTHDIGVAFLKKSEAIPREISDLLK